MLNQNAEESQGTWGKTLVMHTRKQKDGLTNNTGEVKSCQHVEKLQIQALKSIETQEVVVF